MLSSDEAGYFDRTTSPHGGTVTFRPVTVEAIDEILDANEYVVRGVPRTPTEVVDLLFGDEGPAHHRRFAYPRRICDATCGCEDDGPLARVVIDAMRMRQITGRVPIWDFRVYGAVDDVEADRRFGESVRRASEELHEIVAPFATASEAIRALIDRMARSAT